KSVFFFGNIISSYGPIKDYVKELEKVSTARKPLFDQLGEQVFINAKITATKFRNVNLSVRYLSFNIGLVFVYILYYAFKTAL
ncbi:MAG: Pycsar system effector family protein, partial [Algoriphagus sp.]